ncbi:MAG: nucleoside deaminase [Nitrospinota bacterium]|nr:nucleoside deaminase [Nitrospinota bacterium]
MEDHEKFMAMAIEEARLGLQSGEDPFGAVIVRAGEVISTGRSVKIYTGDVTDHAEVGAIGKATRALRNLNLAGCTLYSSCEPCPMCCGAIINTSIEQRMKEKMSKLLQLQFPGPDPMCYVTGVFIFSFQAFLLRL